MIVFSLIFFFVILLIPFIFYFAADCWNSLKFTHIVRLGNFEIFEDSLLHQNLFILALSHSPFEFSLHNSLLFQLFLPFVNGKSYLILLASLQKFPPSQKTIKCQDSQSWDCKTHYGPPNIDKRNLIAFVTRVWRHFLLKLLHTFFDLDS